MGSPPRNNYRRSYWATTAHHSAMTSADLGPRSSVRTAVRTVTRTEFVSGDHQAHYRVVVEIVVDGVLAAVIGASSLGAARIGVRRS